MLSRAERAVNVTRGRPAPFEPAGSEADSAGPANPLKNGSVWPAGRAERLCFAAVRRL